METTDLIRKYLFEQQDLKYRDFTIKLTPTISPDDIIGVRAPILRKYASTLNGTKESADFLNALPHKYYEENNLHAFLIEKIKDFDEAVEAVEKFLPYVNNWATCDSMSPKVFKKHLAELAPTLKKWLQSGKLYTSRFAMGQYMNFYLDDAFSDEYPKLISGVKSSEYYVNMMIAWYFATALAKQYDAVISYFQKPVLDKWTHNKAIQKAIESYRITDEQKAYLRTLKLK